MSREGDQMMFSKEEQTVVSGHSLPPPKKRKKQKTKTKTKETHENISPMF